ncbi:hypothetical protein ACOME3_001896 [Neoechinorhynchus agilis]
MEINELLVDYQQLVEQGHRAVAEWLKQVSHYSQESYDETANRIQHQGHIRAILRNLIQLIDSDLGNVFHHLISTSISQLLRNHDSMLLLDVINKCNKTIEKSKYKICALTVLVNVYQYLNRSAGHSSEETVSICSKIFYSGKLGCDFDAINAKIFKVCSIVIEESNARNRLIHQSILKMVQRALSSPKECFGILDSVAQTLCNLVKSNSSLLVSTDLEKMIFILLDSVAFSVWTEDSGSKWISISESLASLCLSKKGGNIEGENCHKSILVLT